MQQNISRCSWANGSLIYQKYHDEEWGVPVYKDDKLFEMLLLETFQAGLSWITILNKRENFRIAFDNFNYPLIARYQQDKIDNLLNNPGIIRNKLKIHAAINNANRFMDIQEEYGSFSKYLWSFVNHEPINNAPASIQDVPATSAISDALSKNLIQKGFKFVGSTTMYALMQSIGMVNDHIALCHKHVKK